MSDMAQVLILATQPFRLSAQDWLRLAVVCGCALALICAGRALPLL